MTTNPARALMGLPRDLPDRRTALADLRTALCLYLGVDPDDIDPASGHDRSLDAYLRSRASWVRAHAESPGSDWIARNSAEARANWERARPQYLAENPWPEIRHLPEERCCYCATDTELEAATAGRAHPTIRMDLPETACPNT